MYSVEANQVCQECARRAVFFHSDRDGYSVICLACGYTETGNNTYNNGLEVQRHPSSGIAHGADGNYLTYIPMYGDKTYESALAAISPLTNLTYCAVWMNGELEEIIGTPYQTDYAARQKIETAK